MRFVQIIFTLLLTVAMASSVFAVASGKTVDYKGGSAGKVVFDGKSHIESGLKCNDCHTKIFPMKKGATMTMADINGGKYCGVCHNGQKTFKSSEAANCGKCHKK